MLRPRRDRRLASLLLASLPLLLPLTMAGQGWARRPRTLGIYVPAFFKRVPEAMLFDDPRAGAAAFAGVYRTVDPSGQPEQIALSIDQPAQGTPRVTRQRLVAGAKAAQTVPVAGANVTGNRLVAPSLRGRFVVVPYQVVRQVERQVVQPIERQVERQTSLLCRSGLAIDGYRQLFQREEAPRPCPAALIQQIAAGKRPVRRLLVEGRWALVRTPSVVRSRPLESAATIGAVRPGDDVDVIDTLGAWLLIHGGGVEGFVPASTIAN